MTIAPIVNGMFRGVCVDNRDPKNLGRIRVQVPQILGTAASGWAFPAWSFHQKTIWPQDRLPKPGDGVWIMFDSTSPDKMIWIAAFGPLDLINQPEYVERPDFTSSLTMEVLDTPTWNQICRFQGVLSSSAGDVPNPNPTVQLVGRKVGASWVVLGSAPVNAMTGEWSLGSLIQLTGNVEYRATFDGSGVYGPTSSDIVSFNTPTVTFATTLTIGVKSGTPALNKSIEFGGILQAPTAPDGWKIPKDASVNLIAVPSEGAARTVLTNIPVDPATGAWSTSYTITIAGAVDYYVTFAAANIYLYSQSNILPINTSVATSVSKPTVPALFYGSGFNVSGTITVSGTGAAVTSGTAELWWRYTIGSDQTWKKSSATANVTSGTYSLTHPTLTLLGGTEWQIRYLGTSSFDPSNSAVVAATVNLPAQGALTKGAITHTSAAFSWAAVAGATHYEIERWNGSAWIPLTTTTARSYNDTTISPNGQYWWRVRPRATNVAGAYMYGAYSANITMTTGRPAQTASGTSDWISVSTTFFRNHRKDTGWQNDSEMRQGYYSSPYSGDGYIGIAKYGGTTIKNAIIAAIGNDAWANGSCSAAQITLYRSTTGTVGTTDVHFYTTTSEGTGDRPILQGTVVKVAASGYSASKTYNIGTAHGDRLGKASANSVAIYRNTNDYLGLNSSGTNGGKLELKWTWNYTSVSYVAPAWQ